MSSHTHFVRLPALFSLLLISGCGAPIAHYTTNLVYLKNQEEQESADLQPAQEGDIVDALAAMFGTPDEPVLPPGDSGIEELIHPESLRMAAGPVGSDEYGRPTGLYRQHCGHCHGTTGDGNGPTALFLNPYPRDYRRGTYKFKSTPRGSRPTHADLKKTLLNGVAGTSMPSFKLLPENEVEALVDYVKYLSIRGETERALIDYSTQELDEEDRLLDDENLAEVKEVLVDEILDGIVNKWKKAEDEIIPVPSRPAWEGEELLASIQQGKELFYGSVANCVKCHGDSQLGDGQVDDYDDWTKEYAADWIKETDPAKKQAILDALTNKYHALPPRNIIPRNLRAGIYRGGRRPVDLYWRIYDGIDGGPMPAAMMKQPGQSTGLTTDDLWHLINYVQSLPYESMATTGADEPVYSRPRM